MQAKLKNMGHSFAHPPSTKPKKKEKDATTRGISRAQFAFRSKSLYPERLHRQNIAERLIFESKVVFGTARLINQVLVFALFLSALRLSSNEARKRGIFNNLGETFGFDDLRAIHSRSHFVEETLPDLSEKSKSFFPLSSQYFDSGVHGSKLILGDLTVFTQPRPGPEMVLRSTEFSVTAWVRSIPQFAEGYILRKRPITDDEDLTCWGWYLHAQDGPSFIFAGHDHFPTGGDNSEQQIEAKLNFRSPFAPRRYFLLSIVVTETEVSFFQDNLLIGTYHLSRPVTDCFNNGQGVWLGDSGLEIGIVRYFPFKLTNSTLGELMVSGNLLSDIATGSNPSEQVDSELANVGRVITSEVLNIEKGLNRAHENEKLAAVLQQVDYADIEEFLNPGAAKYPNAKVGNNPFDNIERVDSNGREYYRLFEGPEILSETSDADARNMTMWPTFVGTGVTFTFWYRHVECDVASCGMFLFEAIDPGRPEAERKCWNFWIENNAIWYENSVIDEYPRDFVPRNFQIQGGKTWRHIAITLDETTDEFKYYMDGQHAYTGPWRGADNTGRTVRTSDCSGPNRFMTLGRSYPGYTYGLPVGLYDFRMYVHPRDAGNPLTPDEIRTIAQSPSESLDETDKCLRASDPAFFDQEWRDAFGHGCAWYKENRETNPSICRSPLAATNCPIACNTRQECLSTASYDSVFIYDRIRKIEVNSLVSNGTICLGDDEDPVEIIELCRQYVSGTEVNTDSKASQWFRAWRAGRHRSLDFRQCDDLERAIDPFCTYNGTVVKDWTHRVREGGGSYTIAFWIKPQGFGSLINQRFFPTLKFFGSVSPPQHNLNIGLFDNPNGEAQFFTSCGEGQFVMENVELKRADVEGWTFVAVTRSNVSNAVAARVMTNLGSWREGLNYQQCFYNEEKMFRALEFNYAVLISPILLSATMIPISKLQETYYAASGWMPQKTGPEASITEKVEDTGIPVEKKDYSEQSTLVAPPIIFQTIQRPTDQCDYSYSESFINLTHSRMRSLKCRSPFDCDSELLRDPSLVLSCPGKRQEEGMFFGQAPEDFGAIGYSDLLYSVTDNGFLWRNGELVQTAEFISSNTGTVDIIFVFYTPKYGITSVLSLMVDFTDPAGAKSDVMLQHYEVVEGSQLSVYLFVQIIVLVSIAIMVFDIVVNVKYLIASWSVDEVELTTKVGEAVKQLMDISIAVMVIVYIIIRIPTQLSSADDTRNIVGRLAEIPWADTTMSSDEKTESFFGLTRELLDLIDNEKRLNSFCNVVLVLSLLRLIKCTSMHPRLALLEGTVTKAWDDLWHAALLIVMLMGVFAGIATWRFGSEREDFSDFERSMQTQFEMTFGEFPDDWSSTRDLQVYTVFYFMLVFLLVQNFLLAVVVEAYMAVRKDNEDLETEQEFLVDIWSSLHAHIKAFKEGWPTPYSLGTAIERWTAKNSVGFRELDETGLFKSPESIGKFIKYYKEYEFLKPPVIGTHGKEKSDPDEKRAQELELRLSRAVGVNLPSLKEEANAALRKAQRRKNGRRDSESTEDPQAKHGSQLHMAGMFGAGHGMGMGPGAVTDPLMAKNIENANKHAESVDGRVEELAKEVHNKFADTNMQVSMVKDRLRNMDVKMDLLIRLLQEGKGGAVADHSREPSPPPHSARGNGNAVNTPLHTPLGSKVYHGAHAPQARGDDVQAVLDAADRARPPEAPVVDQLAGGVGNGDQVTRAGNGDQAHAQLMFEQGGQNKADQGWPGFFKGEK